MSRRGRENYIRRPDVAKRIGSYLGTSFPLFHGKPPSHSSNNLTVLLQTSLVPAVGAAVREVRAGDPVRRVPHQRQLQRGHPGLRAAPAAGEEAAAGGERGDQ